MDLNEFLWHAKRGHGECLLTLQKGDVSYYKDVVRKVFLNNYAFLKNDEYRSAYACELVRFYNDDVSFLKLLWNKIVRTKLEDHYQFDYLINNLYFILERNEKLNYEKKIKGLLIKKLNKDYYNFDENNSICSLISLILDLDMDISIDEIIDKHYNDFENSNLDLSDIEHWYQITLSEKTKNNSFAIKEIFKDFSELFKHISDEDTFNKELPFIATNIDDKYLDLLLQLLDDSNIDNSIKTNILKVVLYSEKRNIRNMKKLFKLLNKANSEQKSILYEILIKTKSQRILSALNQNNLEDSFFIRLNLKNYNRSNYHEIHEKIIKLKIDYCNSCNWFEVENDLINHFYKRRIDERLLSDLKFFFKNGLSSNSRYKASMILKKFNMLENDEIESLKYDANYKIRQKFKKLAT